MLIPATTTPAAMLTTISPEGSAPCKKPLEKITIVGAGTLGTAIAYTLLVQGLGNEVALIDQNEPLARGEALDMLHATHFLNNQQVTCGTDYSAANLSKIIIITAGARNFDNKETATKQNTEIFRELIPQLISHADNAIFIICSYPVDEMSYVTWKLSGLPPHKVIGAGTYLETTRFRRGIADRMNVHPSCCRAFVIGEHGPKSIPIWSSVNVAGVRLAEVNPDIGTPQDPEDWNSIFRDIVDSAEEVVCLKECASWGMALSVARIVRAILHDTGECFTVSTHIKGCRHGIDKDVFMSLPVILGCDGVKKLIKQSFTDTEKEALQKSADRMFDLFRTLDLDKIEPPKIIC